MNSLKVSDILKCTGGNLLCGSFQDVCDDFSNDTRTIKNGDIYIGIKGANFDGNLFWEDALRKGAKGIIVQNVEFTNEQLKRYNEKVIIVVDNTLQALYKIAKYKRSLYDIPVVAITGSVGKTSTKDLIASVLSQEYDTLKTEGNKNNNIGLPLTILKLKKHNALVLEMGMNHLGEISLLADIAKPTISVITNVGTSHIGNLGSRQNILKAKLEILEGMNNPILVLNNDNDMLHSWYEDNKDMYMLHPFAIENESQVEVVNVEHTMENTRLTCKYEDEQFDVCIPVGGKHFVYNAICSIIIGKKLGISTQKIIDGIESFKLTQERMDKIQLKDNITVINDTYNASVESMKAGIEYLANNAKNRKILILGDMLELGEFSKHLHEQVGEVIVANNIDVLMCLGNWAKYISNKALALGMNKNNVYYFEDKEKLVETLKGILQPSDTILIKASNGMKFFEIVEMIKTDIQ